MSFKIKCRIKYQVFPKKDDNITETDHRIFRAEPMSHCPEIKLDSNLQFSLKGDLIYMDEGEDYDLLVEVLEINKWGTTCSVLECLSFRNLENLSREESEKIMKHISSDSNTKTLLDNYPNFVTDVLSNDWHDVIDTSKLYNIKEAKMNSYTRQLNEKFKYYAIYNKYKAYGISMNDCRKLSAEYKTVDKIDEAFKDNPYEVMIDKLGKRFIVDSDNPKYRTLDEIICEIRPELIDSDIRCEYFLLEVLTRNEQGTYDGFFEGGSTKLKAEKLWSYCKKYDDILNKRMNGVVNNCQGIYYNKETKDMAKMSTYLSELKIAEFVNELYKTPLPYNFEWNKYKQMKEGELTDEQSEILKSVCENRFTIVDALAGSGKSASMNLCLQMLKDNHIEFRCMTATGKSARRFYEASNFACSTIHRACINKEIHEELIVIDEDSLLSIDLLCMVINAISNNNVHCLFLGDLQQLINLSTGLPIKDIIASGKARVCTLSKCFRFGLGGKETVSVKCRRGEMYILDEDLGKDRISYGENNDYTYIKSDGTIEQITDTYLMAMKKYKYKPQDINIVVPFNIGKTGCLSINNHIQSIINPPKVGEETIKIKVKSGKEYVEVCFRQNDIVLNTSNNYNCLTLDGYEQLKQDKTLRREDVDRAECMNGQTGKVLSIKDNVMFIQFDEDVLVFTKSDAQNLLLGIAINCFKIQGSQNKCIILLTLNQHKKLLNKQCLYTGLTRATEYLYEIADISAIQYSVDTDNSNKRDTFLEDMLKEVEITD